MTEQDRFILRQKFRFVVNEYVFSVPQDDGVTPGEPFCFVRQKAFKFKEDIRFYTDETKSVELLRIKARHRFDPRASYDVTDADGKKIGAIQKVFGASMFRSTYRIMDAENQELATAREANLGVALARRLVTVVPYLENFANFLPIPYHFVFERNGVEIGSHRRQLFKFHDTYSIDVSADREHVVDRRLILAIAVGMDALQAR
ncbi:MAG: hypothetical protein LC776_01890 [Acidobacteria bacterium]|nr:hypothetical protein [Acidobacteriota bacterium]